MIFTGMPRRLRISSLQKRVQEREAENSRNEDKVIKIQLGGGEDLFMLPTVRE
jgi:hypothetical protein